jgi:hypothetical protein
MDKVAQHKVIVRDIMNEIADMTPSDEKSETQLITDDEHGHYVLFSIGWHSYHREYAPFVHIDVRPDGKVYLQHDGTDLRIANWMMEKGIPQGEIVLAFHAPFRREMIEGFARA